MNGKRTLKREPRDIIILFVWFKSFNFIPVIGFIYPVIFVSSNSIWFDDNYQHPAKWNSWILVPENMLPHSFINITLSREKKGSPETRYFPITCTCRSRSYRSRTLRLPPIRSYVEFESIVTFTTGLTREFDAGGGRRLASPRITHRNPGIRRSSGGAEVGGVSATGKQMRRFGT